MGTILHKSLTPRERRSLRDRRKISGNPDRPRLSVYKSNSHIYAQVVDDTSGRTLAFASTLSKEIREDLKDRKKSEAAKLVGKLLAEKARAGGVSKVVFDRNGFPYHGRIAAVAEAAREAGLEF